MNPTVTVLTPLAAGAIATLRLSGLDAWGIVARSARTLKDAPLPVTPALHRTYLARWVGDEVVLAVRQLEPIQQIEIHCHGGLRIVRNLVEDLVQHGARETDLQAATKSESPALLALSQAKTFRTASILLDQDHGAFQKALEETLRRFPDCLEELQQLVKLSAVGTRLVTGWKVVIAGAPNAGKSSLLNALAGYERAVVAPTAGTTRDVVSTTLALDGWPFELADTAGLRETTETIEAEGIRRTRAKLQEADLVVWLLDSTSEEPVWPSDAERAIGDQPWIMAWNKADQETPSRSQNTELMISAKTGQGIGALVGQIIKTLIPQPPAPGQGVPYTHEQASLCSEAMRLLQDGKIELARQMLLRVATIA
jgi:tRNA modification GTPase